jgi:hypothetical protein
MPSSPPAPSGRFHEHRDEARSAVPQQPLGGVFLKDRHHVQPVEAIRDVSARGVSLFVHDALMPGEPVVIELRQDGGQVEFYAYVCWCRGDDVEACTDADGACHRHVAGLRVYGPQSLARLITPRLLPKRSQPAG